jgi:hypothetical protein
VRIFFYLHKNNVVDKKTTQHNCPVMHCLTSAGVVLGAVLFISLMSMWTVGSAGHVHGTTAHRLKTLVSEAARYCVQADQDTNPLIATLNATTGKAFVTAARTLASDHDIQRVCKVQASELMQSCQTKQQNSVQHVMMQCPDIAPDSDVSKSTGWVL